MARERKDGTHIYYYLETDLYNRLKDYANSKGQTATKALECILRDFFENPHEIIIRPTKRKLNPESGPEI